MLSVTMSSYRLQKSKAIGKHPDGKKAEFGMKELTNKALAIQECTKFTTQLVYHASCVVRAGGWTPVHMFAAAVHSSLLG